MAAEYFCGFVRMLFRPSGPVGEAHAVANILGYDRTHTFAPRFGVAKGAFHGIFWYSKDI